MVKIKEDFACQRRELDELFARLRQEDEEHWNAFFARLSREGEELWARPRQDCDTIKDPMYDECVNNDDGCDNDVSVR